MLIKKCIEILVPVIKFLFLIHGYYPKLQNYKTNYHLYWKKTNNEKLNLVNWNNKKNFHRYLKLKTKTSKKKLTNKIQNN